MPIYEEIYGTKCKIPDPEPNEIILNADLPQIEQMWRREELPNYFDTVQYDKAGNLMLTIQQEEYAKEEVRRCKKGIFIMINGKLTYIPPRYYFYLQWWVLEDGSRPEYRDTDRRYFTFHKNWFSVQWCLGIIRGKKRREGASSQATANLIYDCIFFKQSNCGLVSKSKDDSRDTFIEMVAYGYRHLPPFLRPKQLNSADSVTELVFAQKSDNIKEGSVSSKPDEQNRSRVSYRAPVLNAYDRSRLSYVLLDECFAPGTKILCDGFIFKNIEDIKVGDWVIVEGGKKVQVAKTCNGFDEMFLIQQPHSKDYIVNSKHRLYLEQRCRTVGCNDDGIKIMTPLDFMNLGKYKKRTTFGVRSKGIDFEKKDVKIDPYLLGLWLGDGIQNSSSFVVNIEKDAEIIDYLLKYAKKINRPVKVDNVNKSIVTKVLRIKNESGGNGVSNGFFTSSLKYYNIYKNKRIPTDYIQNSKDIRLKVLAGIIDTDGYFNRKGGTFEICMSRYELICDIQLLARSLGFSVSKISKRNTNFNTNAYRIHISGDIQQIPTLLKRKNAINYNKRYAYRKNKINVIPIGVGKYFGITLDADNDNDRRLILEDFTISMNCGKLEKDVPASQLFGIISKTLVKGVKRVGFVEMPSTVNKLTKGGSEFKLLWKNADLNFKVPTVNRLVRYFTPAFDGYEGFIDQYGQSVIDAPNEAQYQYLVSKWVQKDEEGNVTSELTEEDIRLGARAYIKKRRIGLEGDLLEEEIRMNPCDETELFMSANADCIFDSIKIEKQLQYLEQNPVYKRKIKFYRDLDQTVKWRDAAENEKDFCWEWIGDLNNEGVEDRAFYEGLMKRPARTSEGVIGVDGISNEQGGKRYGSKSSAWVYTKLDINNQDNTGLFIGHLYGRPKTKDDLHEQIMLCAEFCGYQIYWEFVSDDYYTFFKKRGRLGYLAKFPLIAIPPEKIKKSGDKLERHYGYPTDDFAISKANDTMISYVYHYCHKIKWVELLDDLKQYDPFNRTKSDRTVSAMIALVGSLEPVRKPPPRPIPLIRRYDQQGNEILN